VCSAEALVAAASTAIGLGCNSVTPAAAEGEAEEERDAAEAEAQGATDNTEAEYTSGRVRACSSLRSTKALALIWRKVNSNSVSSESLGAASPPLWPAASVCGHMTNSSMVCYKRIVCIS
jgi:hypothetical protein